jgi:hypothetical protein
MRTVRTLEADRRDKLLADAVNRAIRENREIAIAKLRLPDLDNYALNGQIVTLTVTAKKSSGMGHCVTYRYRGDVVPSIAAQALLQLSEIIE